jgi:hypothetical protein
MADIFLSYASEELHKAKHLAQALTRAKTPRRRYRTLCFCAERGKDPSPAERRRGNPRTYAQDTNALLAASLDFHGHGLS